MITQKELQISFLIIFIISILMITKLSDDYIVFVQATESIMEISKTITMKNQDNTSEPVLSVKAFCQAAQTDIPGDFTATGFTPNSDVIVETNQNNSTGKLSTEPVTVLLSKSTDSVGNVTGAFVLNTNIQQPTSYSGYFLHVYSVNNPQESASTSLDIC